MTLAAAVGLAFSGAAFAQGPDRGDQGQFGQGQGQSQRQGQGQGQGQGQRQSSQSQSQSSGEFKAFQSTEHGQEAQRQMQTLDTNRDQRLDRQEAQSDSELMAAWTDVDINRDGSVDTAEYYLFSATKAIADMEGQQSASVGGGELGGGFGAQNQGQGQQPGQGGLQSRQGQQQPGQGQGGLQSREGQQPGQGGLESRGGQEQDQGGFQARSGQGSQSFEDVDIDRNGQISQSELSRVGGASFATLDSNSDGQIDRQEYSERAIN